MNLSSVYTGKIVDLRSNRKMLGKLLSSVVSFGPFFLKEMGVDGLNEKLWPQIVLGDFLNCFKIFDYFGTVRFVSSADGSSPEKDLVP